MWLAAFLEIDFAHWLTLLLIIDQHGPTLCLLIGLTYCCPQAYAFKDNRHWDTLDTLWKVLILETKSLSALRSGGIKACV